MSLVTTIDEQLATAMREQIAARVAVLRLIKTGLKNEQIKVGHELSDDEALKVLAREAKQRKDSIQAYTDAGRNELAEDEAAELKIIQEFLPEQMSEAELSALVDTVIAETNAASPAEMGVVIGAVMKQAAGKADGAMVSQLVRQKLAQ